MSDKTQLVSRRNALKGLTAFAGASVVGAGTILNASEPVVAASHGMEIDDITISSYDGEISQLGFSDLWFEVEWENVPTDVRVYFMMHHSDVGPNDLEEWERFGTVDLGIDGAGSETFGYGDEFEDSYDVDLDGPSHLDGASPLYIENSLFYSYFLDEYFLDDDQEEKSVPTSFGLQLFILPPTEEDEMTQVDSTEESFTVTVQRLDSQADANEGEGVAYGEE